MADTIKDGANSFVKASGFLADLLDFTHVDPSGRIAGERWADDRLRALWKRLHKDKGPPPDGRDLLIADIRAYVSRLEADYAARTGGSAAIVVGGSTEKGIG